MLGRMDLSWDGTGPPKLLEYNGDTPSVLVESSAPQLNWMRDMRAGKVTTLYQDIIQPGKKLPSIPSETD